jgi:ABC-type nitrate/sulfonate/bicarbonate transport system substrate-binding protein
MQWTIMVANDDLLLHEPDLISSVLSACRRSYHYAAKHRTEWVDFGARYFRIQRGTMTRSIERELPDLHFDCEVDTEGLAAAIALQQRLGGVPASLRLNDIVDPRFTAGGAQLAAAG